MKFANKMKIFTILICMMLLCDVAIAFERTSRATRHSTKSLIKSHSKFRVQAIKDNKWYQFFSGFFFPMTQQESPEEINGCLPPEWRITTSQDKAQAERDEAWKNKAFAAMTILEKIQKFVETVVTVVCKIVNKISVSNVVSFITGGISKKYYRLYRRHRRMMFLEGSFARKTHFTKRMNRLHERGPLKIIHKVTDRVEKIADKAGHVVDHITDGAIQFGGKVRNITGKLSDGVKAGFRIVSGGIKTAFEGVRDRLVELKNWVASLIGENGIFETIKKICECIKTLGAAVGNIINTIKNFVDKINQIIAAAATTYGFAVWFGQFVIRVICQFEKFKDAFHYAQTAYKSTDIVERYHYTGRAIGQVFEALANARRRFRRKMK